jgi:hypothetical protein
VNVVCDSPRESSYFDFQQVSPSVLEAIKLIVLNEIKIDSRIFLIVFCFWVIKDKV